MVCMMAHERKLLKWYMKTENWNKIEKNDIVGILDAFEMWLHQDWITSDDWEAVEIVWTTLRNVITKILVFNASTDHHVQLLRIFEFCLQYDLVGKAYLGGQLTLHGHVVKEILLGFVHPNHINPDVIVGFIPHAFILMKLGLSHVKYSAASFIYTLNAYPKLLLAYIDDIMECYLKYHHFNLAACLTVLFPYHEDIILAHLTDISQHIDELPAMEKYSVFRLYEAIAEKHPQEILPYMRYLTADFSDAVVSSASLPCLCVLSNHYTDRFTDLVDKLSMLVERQPYHVGYVDRILTKVAMQSETDARKVLTNCLVQFKAVDEFYYPAIFTCIRDIGLKYKKLLSNYQSAIEAFGANGGKTQSYVQSLMEYLEGKSETPDFVKLQTPRKVQQSSGPTPMLSKKETNRKSEAAVTKSEASTSKKTMEKRRDKAATDKEQQDITPVPDWCSKIAVLLDKSCHNDWRFLAINLGFSLDDVQSISMTASPTTSVLDQWFKTHPGKDGTYAVYVALQQLKRNDAMEVIEQSVPKNEQLIPQTFSGTEDKIASVCISYHADNIIEVKLLCYHLELAGLECWMDEEIINGTDKPFQRMDEAMRGSQLVLVMCSASYMQSKTCFKQVNLAQQLNKPIIPVIIGPLSWPPTGPMSIIFSQLPCQQLYQFSANNRRGRIYWPLAHFLELLARIYYYVSPNLDKISKQEYKCLVPTLDTIPYNLQEHLLKVPVNEKDEESSIFISYQWSKIGEALVLSTLLTHLGFSCWLDVHNLGDGNLTERAETAIRKSKVMICCVTPEYCRQPSCCREVTLASVLQLPIIPLVMEQMFWPPRGPLTMPFTKCLYIDFTCEELEASFTYQKLQELYDKLKQFVVSKKDSKVEELFTKTLGMPDLDLSASISSDGESADELNESETVEKTIDAESTENGNTKLRGILRNGNTVQQESLSVAQVQSQHSEEEKTKIVQALTSDAKENGIPVLYQNPVTTDAKTGNSVQQSEKPLEHKDGVQQTQDNHTIAKIKTDVETCETAQDYQTHSSPNNQNHKHGPEQQILPSNGVSHLGPKTDNNNASNGKICHSEKPNQTIISNDLPSKTDEEIKKSNVCTIL
ncbi:uncharacterized protein LOC144443515 [Glandiceps talaboti]